MKTTKILMSAAVLALLVAAPARAEEGMMDNVKVGFGQAIKGIQNWFGSDTPDTVEPAAGEAGFEVTTDDSLQVPTPLDPSIVEPAAGNFDDDVIQVPPPYMGPDNTNTGTPRASAFDNTQSNSAFNDSMPAIDNYNDIAPAAGEGADTAIDCQAITAASGRGEKVDAELLTSCTTPAPAAAAATPTDGAAIPVASDAANVTPTAMEPAKAPAQPAFEIDEMPAEATVTPTTPATPGMSPIVTPEPLPETEPAVGQ